MTDTPNIDIVNLAAELAHVLDAKKQLEEREKAIKSQLRMLGEGQHAAGTLKVIVTPQRRVSEDLVKEFFPITEFPHFWKQAPNLDIIKSNVPPNTYQNLMRPYGEAKVSVK